MKMTIINLLNKCYAVVLIICPLVSTLTPTSEPVSQPAKCESGRFYCHKDEGDYQCIPKLWVCNRVKDCNSGEDEALDLCKSYHASTKCTEEEFECLSDHVCLPLNFRCDNDRDCIDGTDEANCTDLVKSFPNVCHPNQAKCLDDNRCISSKFLCDGVKDCIDGSDEEHCKDACTEALHHFHCNSGVGCPPVDKVCDGNVNCPDGSDENGRCGDKSCDLPCVNGHCYKSPGGPRCLCNAGYEEHDGKCEDIDECNRFSVCDHYCTNSDGNFTCSCKNGYTLLGKEICKASGDVSAILLYTSNKDVRALNLNTRDQSEVYSSGSKPVTAVTYDPISEQVYWSDNSRMVLRKSLKGSDTPYIIIHSGIGVIYDLVMDWVGRNIYMADRDNKRIVVCNVITSSCKSLMTKPVIPTALKLDIINRRIYWSDTVEHQILTASMDGTDTRVLISQNLTWPNAMDIDSPARRLYWMDAQKKNLGTYALDQEVRREVPGFELNHPFSMAVWEDKIYWNDWNENAIYSAHKKDGRNKTLIIRDHKGAGISIFHPQMIKDAISGENPCKFSDCSHLCLLRPTNLPYYTCACPSELQLAGNGKNCIDKEEATWLAVGVKDSLYKMQSREFGDPLVRKVPHSDLKFKRISDVDYDPIDGSVFIADMGSRKIVKINLQLSKVTTILTNLQRPTGIAVDWTRGNLYWVNNFSGGLEVSTTSGLHRSKLSLETRCLGMDVAVSPSTGRVVIACEAPGRILSCYRNGAPCTVLSGTSVRTPLGLAIAQRGMEDYVYWTDASGNRVYRTSLDGSGSQSFTVNSPAAIHFANGKLFLSRLGLFNSLFYTTNISNESYWNELNLNHAGIDSGSRRSRGYTTLAEVGWLVSDARQRSSLHKFCIEGQKQCEQLCLENEHSIRVCACATDYMLDDKMLTCIPKHCLADQHKCLSDGRCIPKSLRCNGVDDCTDASDESSILCKACPESSFQCQSRECIDKNLVCDGRTDCLDNSDERNCRLKACHEGYTYCTDGIECYLNVSRCDGVADCADRSDEEDCLACPPDQFLCVKGLRQCHPKAWVCNGVQDCLDGSDEADCSESCSPPLFLCSSDNVCIDGSKVCDSKMDCSRGEDELTESCLPTANDCSSPASNCTLTCKVGDYPCKSGRQCIDESLVCDGVSQCTDASDEGSCTAIYTPGSATYTHCPRDSFACADGISCIRGDGVCDGIQDCVGGDDEDAQCEDACKDGGGCEHICQKGPLGARCSCRGGYKLASDRRSCQDVNECSVSDPCEQKCVNIDGGFRCRCSAGYALAPDQVSCRPTNGRHSRVAYVSDGSLRWLGGTVPGNVSLAGHTITQLHYDAAVEQLMAFDTVGTLCPVFSSSDPSSSFFSVMTGFSPASLFALDAPARNVYVASTVRGQLHAVATLRVCSLGSGVCYSVYEESDVEIAAVTLASTHRMVFFCINGQDGASVSRIVQAQPDGSRRMTIVEKHSCSHLALDEHKQHIYWVDPELRQISSASWSGDGVAMYTPLTSHALSLSVSGSWVVWLLSNGTLQRCQKLASRSCHPVVLGREAPSAVTVTRAARLQISPTCLSNPCQHLCLPSAAGRQCLCEGENEQRCSTVNVVQSGCDPDPCTPGGTCQPGVCGSYTCRCLPGYEGSTCYVSKEGLQLGSNYITPLVVVMILLLLGAAAAGAYYYFYYKKPLFLFMRKTSRSSPEVRFSNPAFGASKDEIDATLRVTRNLDMSKEQAAGRLVTVHVDTEINLADHGSQDGGSSCTSAPGTQTHYSLM